MAANKTAKSNNTPESEAEESALRVIALESAVLITPQGHSAEALNVAKTFLAFLKGEDVAND